MDEDHDDLFPEHRPPPHHAVSWDDVWGTPPDRAAPVSGSNALVVRPEPGPSSDVDPEVSLLPARAFDAPPPEPQEVDVLPANLFGDPDGPEEDSATPEAIDGPSFIHQPIDPFAEQPEATFRQFLHAEGQDHVIPDRGEGGYALPEVWSFSSGRRTDGGRRAH